MPTNALHSAFKSLLGIWTIVAAFLCCSATRKVPEVPILPIVHVTAPSEERPSSTHSNINDMSLHWQDNSTWRSSWQADKARFMESPILAHGEQHSSQDLGQHGHKPGTRRVCKRITGMPTVIHPAPPTSEASAGGCMASDDKELAPVPPDTSPTPCGGVDGNRAKATITPLTRFGQNKLATKIVCKYLPSETSRQCYQPNPLSAVSGYLFDAVPNVVLRSVPVPHPKDNDGQRTRKAQSFLEPVPYPDLFDFSLYDRRASRRSDILITTQSKPPNKENNFPSARPSHVHPAASADFTKVDSSAFLSHGVGILTPPLYASKRFGVCTGPTTMNFGTTSILNCPPLSATSARQFTATDEKDPVCHLELEGALNANGSLSLQGLVEISLHEENV